MLWLAASVSGSPSLFNTDWLSGSVKPPTARQRSGNEGPRVQSPGATAAGQWEARMQTPLQNSAASSCRETARWSTRGKGLGNFQNKRPYFFTSGGQRNCKNSKCGPNMPKQIELIFFCWGVNWVWTSSVVNGDYGPNSTKQIRAFLGWHAVLLLLTCGPDLANRSRQPKFHQAMWYAGQMWDVD